MILQKPQEIQSSWKIDSFPSFDGVDEFNSSEKEIRFEIEGLRISPEHVVFPAPLDSQRFSLVRHPFFGHGVFGTCHSYVTIQNQEGPNNRFRTVSELDVPTEVGDDVEKRAEFKRVKLIIAILQF